MKRELTVPPDVQHANEAIEVFRGWLIDNRLQCSLLPTIWKDEPEMWGVLLADAAHHVADALAHAPGGDRPRIMAKIVTTLLRELSQSTDDLSGGFMSRS